MEQSNVILISLVTYKAVLVGIGIWASRRVRNEADFLLGGRNLGPWVAGLSYAASTSSAWVLLGFSGFVFVNGVSALWMIPGIWGGYVAVWLWLGPQIRRESSEGRLVTPTDLLVAKTGGSERRSIAVLAALLIVFCFVFYIAAQFDAAAQAFVGNFAMDRNTALLLGAAIILIYCLLGGFWAASVTDMLQAIVMMSAAVLVPTLAVVAAGGPAQIAATLAEPQNAAFSDWSGGFTLWVFAGFLLGVWGIGLGALGQPQLIARLMAVRGEAERRKGFAISMGWAVIVFIGMAWLALAARSLAVDAQNGEQLFYLMAGQLLPPVVAGLVIAAILSAVMSTVDSLLLAASAAVSHDLGLAQRIAIGEIWVPRIVMTIITVAAVTLALVLPDTIFNRVLFAWSALGAAFGPLLAVRVLGFEPAARARFWSILTGFAVTVLFYTLGTFDPAEAGSATERLLTELAGLPGDPFERVVPWIPALLILFRWRKRA
ncbi:MAG: sodium/proline symporter [Gammaproteobacteria bacterium]|nr:sodium/proline symporter [Gammaproteobacteria bacterium]